MLLDSSVQSSVIINKYVDGETRVVEFCQTSTCLASVVVGSFILLCSFVCFLNVVTISVKHEQEKEQLEDPKPETHRAPKPHVTDTVSKGRSRS